MKARVRSWEVQEKNGMVFVWHHADDKPPEWDFPAMPEIGHPDWSEPRTHEVTMHAYVQDAHERFEKMQEALMGGEKAPSERVIAENADKSGGEYRLEMAGPHPVDSLRLSR